MFRNVCVPCFGYALKMALGTRACLTHLEAVKTQHELVAMALMGDVWALSWPTREQLSAFHSFSMPPRQLLSSTGGPPGFGMKLSAQIQSLWAWFRDWTSDTLLK